MTLKISSSVLLTVLICLVSCTSREDRLIARINELEKKMAEDSLSIPDKDLMNNLIALYAEYGEKFPEKEKAPEFLFSAGRLSMSCNQPDKAIGFFDTIISNYPDYTKLPDCYFLKAFVYDNQLSNLPLARKTYEQLIERYPKHELSYQASQLLLILGKDLEEIVNGFENKGDTVAVVEK